MRSAEVENTYRHLVARLTGKEPDLLLNPGEVPAPSEKQLRIYKSLTTLLAMPEALADLFELIRDEGRNRAEFYPAHNSTEAQMRHGASCREFADNVGAIVVDYVRNIETKKAAQDLFLAEQKKNGKTDASESGT